MKNVTELTQTTSAKGTSELEAVDVGIKKPEPGDQPSKEERPMPLKAANQTIFVSPRE
jgi:hypothetical protein